MLGILPDTAAVVLACVFLIVFGLTGSPFALIGAVVAAFIL